VPRFAIALRSRSRISPLAYRWKWKSHNAERLWVTIFPVTLGFLCLCPSEWVMKRQGNSSLIHNSPKYLEWNLVLEKSKWFFPLRYAILSFWKCLNNEISGFQRWYILNCDNIELKRSSKIIFSVAERHRWAVVGYTSAVAVAAKFFLVCSNWMEWFVVIPNC